MSEHQKWPQTLMIVRHGQSAGNVARDAAEAARQVMIDLATRDADVPLSARGERQAQALGDWLRRLPPGERPNVILASPYVRARQTAILALDRMGVVEAEEMLVIDERLREKEFGILDRLTNYGVAEKFPDQAEFRRLLGKFYHRPPGGESWCDVILRLRSVVDTIAREYRRERVLIVSHQVVVLCFRYLMERMTEAEILAVDRDNLIANCSVTAYEFDPNAGRQGKLSLKLFNFVAPIEEAGEEVTRQPDVPIGMKASPGNELPDYYVTSENPPRG